MSKVLVRAMGLIAGIIGMARALGNLIENWVAIVVIAAWEKDLDLPQARQVLTGGVMVHLTTDGAATVQPAE